MKKKKSTRYIYLLALALMLAALLLAGCAGGSGADGGSGAKGGSGATVENGTSLRLQDLAKAKIGGLTGTIFGDIVHEELPDTEILFFNSNADGIAALKSGKVDAIALDGPVALNMAATDEDLTTIPEEIGVTDFAYALAKTSEGEALCENLSAYMRELKSTGVMDELLNKWINGADPLKVEMTDYESLPATNGTIRLAGEAMYAPFFLLADGKYMGYEVEIVAMYCRDRGYALEIMNMNFDAILPAVQSGRCDLGASCISVTEERKETTLFSEPDYTGGTALLVLKDEVSSTGFWQGLAESFEKTFIREDRWKMFLEGVGTTIFITLMSILLGTALGFFVFMACRNGNRAANLITRFCVWLVTGMPIVVLLMILYYIVFSKMLISGAWIAIICFTLVFGASVYSMIKAGVGAVGPKQLETAYALGYTNRRAFYRVILPQALPHFMPAYKSSITETIKATAVVGYVAVQDLTKMGDLVRSRTYDAFFPLIAVAVIYFVIAALMIFVVRRIEVRIDPRQRSEKEILKGVTAHD
ncbi:MAG: transporter substrate-binding domain-containing protein [Lachnospiraceae bacterium]|nr:transporter substrate-binding domain-containing protein [Lachnospiraceae bacterium]